MGKKFWDNINVFQKVKEKKEAVAEAKAKAAEEAQEAEAIKAYEEFMDYVKNYVAYCNAEAQLKADEFFMKFKHLLEDYDLIPRSGDLTLENFKEGATYVIHSDVGTATCFAQSNCDAEEVASTVTDREEFKKTHVIPDTFVEALEVSDEVPEEE